ncbi:MAG: hypothetical protein O2825_05975 [Proteobacteria bacterium]|nr:hypothetical protein [Pseudomonadota bacterium]
MDRGLTTIKIVVVVLGLLIVAATVVLVMAAIDQAGKPAEEQTGAPATTETTVPAAETAVPAAAGFADVAVALPAGARVVSMIGQDAILTLLVQTPDGAQSILTLDRRSGEILGTLELLPRSTGDN